MAVLPGGISTCGGPVFSSANGAVFPACTKSPANFPSPTKRALNFAGPMRWSANAPFIEKTISLPFNAISFSGAPLSPNPGMVMEPCQPLPLLSFARSTMSFNWRPGICTAPSHRPAAFSSAREMSVEARSKINAIRMRSAFACVVPAPLRSCKPLLHSTLCGHRLRRY